MSRSERSRRKSSAIEVLPLLLRPTMSVVRSSIPIATCRRSLKFSISTCLFRISFPPPNFSLYFSRLPRRQLLYSAFLLLYLPPPATPPRREIGRAHVGLLVTHAHLICSLLLDK